MSVYALWFKVTGLPSGNVILEITSFGEFKILVVALGF